jgi:LacI family transcriptional regulator
MMQDDACDADTGGASSAPLPMAKSRKTKSSRAATLADVGRAAGVSAMAASAVLNAATTSARISPATRVRILEAAAKLQYRPNAAARALLHRRMNTIGIAAVLDDGELTHYFLELFNGVLAAATHFGQNTTVFGLHDWGEDTRRLHSICDGRIDGLILFAPTFDRVMAATLPRHTPFVSIHANDLFPGIVNIESDEEKGAFAMVEFLIAQGHRRVMHLAGPEGNTGADRRVTGYKAALKKHGVRFEKSLLIHAGYDPANGRDAMLAWLKQHAGEALPHAVFCANDSAAIGCMEALADWGLRVPDDISVAGFDDTLASRASVPRLTTVRQPLLLMGRIAAEILLGQTGVIREGTVPASPVVMPIEVVPRDSVGPRPSVDRLVPAAKRR